MEVIGLYDVEEIEFGFGGVVFVQVASGDCLCGSGIGIDVDDELDAVVGIELVWGILFYDEVLAGEPGGFVHAASKLAMDICNDLEGIVAMGIGEAIGEENG